MQLKRKHINILILLLFGCTRLHAQDSTLVGKTIKWDLIKCIDNAKKNNVQINSLRLSMQTSQQEYLLAKAARLPNLSGTATQNFSHTDGSGSGASGNYGLSSSVTLYNGNYINNTILQKNLAVQAANLSIVQQENDITLQITQAYLAILLDKENIIFDTDQVNTSQAQVKLEQQRYDVGSVARAALIQLQAQQATDKYTLVNAKNTERGDILTLKQLLVLPSDVDFDIMKPDTIVRIDSVTSFHETEKIALTNRPEVKNGELGVKIAQYDVDKANAGYLPTLT